MKSGWSVLIWKINITTDTILWSPHMLSSWGHNWFICPRGQGRGHGEIKCREDEDSMRTADSLSSVLDDEDTRTRIPSLVFGLDLLSCHCKLLVHIHNCALKNLNAQQDSFSLVDSTTHLNESLPKVEDVPIQQTCHSGYMKLMNGYWTDFRMFVCMSVHMHIQETGTF